MKATFLYSNGKTFSISGLVENSLEIIRLPRKGLPDLVTVKYERLREISPDILSTVVGQLLENESAKANGVTSEFIADSILYGLEGREVVTIPATENGLLYILLKEEMRDDEFLVSNVFADLDTDINIKPVVIVPVLDKKIDPLILADCISCMI